MLVRRAAKPAWHLLHGAPRDAEAMKEVTLVKAPIARSHKPGWIGELQAFIMRGNVVDRAVGIVIGAALTAIVNSLVKDLFTPLSGLVLGGLDFQTSS